MTLNTLKTHVHEFQGRYNMNQKLDRYLLDNKGVDTSKFIRIIITMKFIFIVLTKAIQSQLEVRNGTVVLKHLSLHSSSLHLTVFNHMSFWHMTFYYSQ